MSKQGRYRFLFWGVSMLIAMSVYAILGCNVRAGDELSNAVTSCGNECNGIYYWRTTFSLNNYEKKFLKDHNVKKLYVRFFDVGNERNYYDDDYIVPEATIQFTDSVPTGIEIVPTVYITNSGIENMPAREEEFARKIFRRVSSMCRGNGLEFRELQLDCDWTKHTRESFFKLCESVKQLMDSTQMLSSTIRLHQLVQTPPPVDKGVLMVYNTGNLMKLKTENSIFSRKDIEPYLRNNRLAKYSLPLDVAYPAYGWSLVFYEGEREYYFRRIIRRTDFSDFPAIRPMGRNRFKVESNVDLSPESNEWNEVYTGDIIKVERPTASEILEVKRLIDRQLSGKPHNNILYHLDEKQLSHYSYYDINEIYSCY